MDEYIELKESPVYDGCVFYWTKWEHPPESFLFCKGRSPFIEYNIVADVRIGFDGESYELRVRLNPDAVWTEKVESHEVGRVRAIELLKNDIEMMALLGDWRRPPDDIPF